MLLAWFRNGLFLIIFLFLCGLFFLLGLQYNFPGQAIAGYADEQLAARTPLHLQLAPLEWKNPKILASERVVLSHPSLDPYANLFVLENLRIDFLPSFPWMDPRKILEPDLRVTARAYGGEILAVIDPVERDQAELVIENLTLDDVPALHLIPYMDFKGSLWLQGRVHDLQALQNGTSRFPQGKMTANLKNVRITPKNLGELIPGGLALPPMTFPEIHLELNYDRFLTIHRIHLTGAIEGTIEGKIFLNQRNWKASRVQLRFKLKLSEETGQALGPMVLIFRGFECGDWLDFDLSGTLARLNPPTKRTCL